MSDEWYLVKRGLYYRANDCGYTGIRDHAGVYSGDEARARLSPGIAMVKREHAPEFSEACFDDLARDHLSEQRDQARAQLERANRIIGWMMPYVGRMCPPPNGLYDLNSHCSENKVPDPGDVVKGRPIDQGYNRSTETV